MDQHRPSDYTNPGRLITPGVQSVWSGMDMDYIRLRAKARLQTRMLMVRYSVGMTESERRFAWGDR